MIWSLFITPRESDQLKNKTRGWYPLTELLNQVICAQRAYPRRGPSTNCVAAVSTLNGYTLKISFTPGCTIYKSEVRHTSASLYVQRGCVCKACSKLDSILAGQGFGLGVRSSEVGDASLGLTTSMLLLLPKSPTCRVSPEEGVLTLHVIRPSGHRLCKLVSCSCLN